MNTKTTRGIALILCMALAFAICLTACGKGEKKEQDGDKEPTDNAATGFTGEKYIDEGGVYTIKTEDLPANYTCVPDEKFVAGFKSFVDGTITSSSTYADVAKAFGDDGIKMAGIQYEGYAYYTWYSDKDYLSDTKVNVLVTFKVSGNNLTYFAYSANGINAQDVK